LIEFLLINLFIFFKISKKELDRQRAKGLSHNPTRIAQLENQIRQYEQQLNEIKRRLESLEVRQCLFL
jgi:chaperonin cofactor prefoldin